MGKLGHHCGQVRAATVEQSLIIWRSLEGTDNTVDQKVSNVWVMADIETDVGTDLLFHKTSILIHQINIVLCKSPLILTSRHGMDEEIYFFRRKRDNL